jgi:iron complex outermembrane receptor protein
VTGGLRYDYERQLEHVMGEYQHAGMPSAIITQPDTAGRVSFHALSPKLGLDYSFDASSMLYAVWSRGYRTGGLTQLSGDPSSLPLVGFRPEYSNNYEVGLKSTVAQGVLRFNVAVFYSHINDAQVPTLVLPDAITVTRNTGRLNSHGAEADVAAVVLRGLELDYHFGYTYTKFSDLTVSQNGSAVDLAGRHQVFSPDITSMLALQYSASLGAEGWKRRWKAVVRGEWKYLGTTYYDLANAIKQSPYSLFHLRAGFAGPGIELLCWGRNVGDKRYVDYAYDFGAYHLGDPRSYGVTVYLNNTFLKKR